MDTDKKVDLLHSPNLKLIHKEETHQIIGCAFEVLNGIGHGLHEKVYENALAVEFEIRAIPFEKQRHFPILYKQVLVADFIPDMIAFGSVIVDAKVIERVTDHERGQMINYLRIAKPRVGLILNFQHAKLEFDRVVL